MRFLVGTLLPERRRAGSPGLRRSSVRRLRPPVGRRAGAVAGELSSADGRLRDIHLKGSGPPPFARGGDGWAVVGPMLREYVVSESMHALSIPTTRLPGRRGYRSPGAARDPATGALLVRVASSHLPRRSFQYAAFTATSAYYGGWPTTRSCAITGRADAEHPYLALSKRWVAAQASLIAHWMPRRLSSTG
ncbi:hypothetical protein I545_6966 [Mycobacterium kansasii 662]|uniref:Uncharacterized protein n=1 Tax=Mycobacterium kansasii 662 TaxID=1299326 RepID=X7XQM4_MYCKA|nr:hypothetical protein I545_6966 [Mycobacterium kansasii 662]